MSESHDETRLWPASPFHLADAHRCPSCFTVVTAPICPSCDFALTDDRAPRVLELGRRILSTELERQQLMDEIRLAHAPAPTLAAAAVPVPAAVRPPAVPAAPPATLDGLLIPDLTVTARSVPVPPSGAAPAAAPVTPTAPITRPSAPAPASTPAALRAGGAAHVAPAAVTAPAPRRRLTVPVVLLIVGVSLVGVAAVFFLLLAWFVAGIAVRALIIGGITLATIALASWLRRRDLTATAEGIGALGVVLLALDAWAVRANDLFGAASGDGAVYAGISALVVATLCRGWARVSRLRGPDLAASLALPAGLGFLIAGVASLPPAEALTAGLLGAAAGGLAHALPAPWSSARPGDGMAERLVLAVTGVAALTAAGVAAAVLTGDAVAVVVWSTAGILVLGVAHAWAAHRVVGGAALPIAVVVEGVASSVAVAAVATAGWRLAVRTELPLYAVLVAPVLAVVVAFAVDLLRARRGERTWIPAAIVSATIAGVSIVVAGVTWIVDGAELMRQSWSAWRTEPFALPLDAPDAPYLALLTAVVVGALLLLAPTLRRPWLRPAVPVLCAVLLLAAGARTGVPAVLSGVGVAAATAALLVLVIGRTRVTPVGGSGAGADAATRVRPSRRGWLTAGAVGAAAAYFAGAASPGLWLVGVAVAIAYPVGVRLAVRPRAAAAVAWALAPVAIAAVSALIAPAALSAATGLAGGEEGVTIALLQWVAVAALGAAIGLPLERASRAALVIAGEALVAIALVATAVADGQSALGATPPPLPAMMGEPAFGIVRGTLLLSGLTVVALRLTRVIGVPTLLGAALVAPVAVSTVFDALRTFGVGEAEWAPLALTGAAVAVPAASALVTMIRRSPTAATDARPTAGRPSPLDAWALRRLAGDLGAAAAVATVAWPVSDRLRWGVLALIALGFAAASVTRGWTAPDTGSADDFFAIRRNGVSLRVGWRRLLAWPAVGAMIAAWWSWLAGDVRPFDDAVEWYAVPAALALVVFAVALIRLRRRVEASVAVALGLAVGLWGPAVAGWAGGPVRGMVVAVVATAIALTLSLTAVRGIRPVAPAGGAVAVVALGMVALERAGDGPAWQVLWLVLLVAVAYASAAGMVAARPAQRSSRAYALLVPAAALLGAVVAVVPLADEARIVAGTLIMLGALHLAAAGLDRLPLTSATRWISLAGAAAVGTAGWLFGAATEVEAVSLPVAVMCLLGAVLAMLRRRRAGASWPGEEGVAWLAGLLIAVLPSLPASLEPARVWVFVGATLAAGLGAAAVREPESVARSDAERAPERQPAPAAVAPDSSGQAAPPAFGTARRPLFPTVWTLRAPTALLLGAAALAMGLRGLLPPGSDGESAAAVVAATGAIALAAVLVARGAPLRPVPGAAVLAGAGTALLVVAILTRPDVDPAFAAVVASIGGVLGVVGALVRGRRRWALFGGTLAIGGLVTALTACGVRFLLVLGEPGLEPDLWALAGAGIAAAVGLAALRTTAASAVARGAGAGFAVASATFGLAELALLSANDAGDDIRTVLAMSALSAAAGVGAAARARIGAALVITASVTAALFAVAALVLLGVRPMELATVPPAVAGIAYGARTLRRDSTARTWPALGPWLALLTVPSLVLDLRGAAPWFGESQLWRIVALGIVAIAMVIVGAVRRLQAPLLLGSAVLLLHAGAQLWPWISAAYVAVPWWLWLGIGGALLIYIAARYEKRMRALRSAYLAVASLR